MNSSMTLTTSYARKVQIPSGFFLAEAQKEYYYIQQRLIAELLQNSVDAGATNIEIEFTDEYYSFRDNGTGMDVDTLVNGLLTMGGSIKTNNSTGGFGAAKKLIIFSHKNYEVVTNNIVVEGAVLDYNLEEKDHVIHSGTFNKCYYTDSELFCKENMVDAAYIVLSRCYFKNKIKVYINDVEYTDFPEFKGIKTEASFGSVYTYIDKNNKKATNSYITVLHNGMYMFNSYIGCSTNMNIVVNVNLPSKEVFAQNRGSFIGEYEEEFSQIKTKLLSNKKSLITNKVNKFCVQGLSDFAYTANKKAQAAFHNERNIDYSNNVIIQDTQLSKVEQTLNKIVEYKSNNNSLPVHKHTIHYICPESMDEKEMAKILPGTWIEKYKFVLSLFSTIINEIARIRQDNISYSLGFIIEEGTTALIEMSDNKTIFYVNPYIFKRVETMKEKFYMMFMTAIHEYCHYLLQSSDHDETFSSTLTNLTSTILTNMNGVIELTKVARANNL